jgi:hypothetical protein
MEGLPFATHVSVCPEPVTPRELPALLVLERVDDNLFGIASDILYSTSTDCAYVDYPEGPGHGSTEDCDFSLETLNAPIVFSTHLN